MVDIVDTPSSFVAVPRVEVSDIALGGNEINVPNKQYKALAQRDKFLKDQVDAIIGSLGSTTPIPNSVKLFGGSGGQGNYTLNSGTDTFADGFYYFNNFTIASGATLNISQFAKIFCLGTVSIAGSIVVSGFSTGGAPFGTYNLGNIGGLSGSGPGAGSGSSTGSGGQSYSYAAAGYGSGGAGGFLNAETGGGTLAGGGLGGGGLWIEAAGTVSVASTANITALGGNGSVGALGFGTGDISGGGGGSGGMVLLSSLVSVTVAGTCNVRGGNGGNAAAGNARGGGGGGGGQVILIAPVTTTTGATITLTAGTAGSSTGTGALGGGNGGGFGGAGGGGGTGGSAAAIGRLITRNFRAVG